MSTYTPIASQTLGSAAASVTFSSIPQGYTDLVIVVAGTVNTGSYFTLRLNNDTASNYSNTEIDGNGTAAASNRNTSNSYMYNGSIMTTQSNVISHIQNYSNGVTFKTVLTRSNYTSAGVKASVGLWRNTSAITSIEIGTGGVNTYQSGSTFSIYGIQVGNPAAKAQGGNIVTTDGTYFYHTFTSSGYFVPSAAITADYLVVAGGGGGGGINANGGGGGAGGLRSTVTATGGGGTLETPLSLISGTSYPVIVGAGGAGAEITRGIGSNGTDSLFGTVRSLGGGGGGCFASGDARSGGSGGGSAHPYPFVTTWAGGAGTANQGYAGGNGISYGPSTYGGAGGGGAGAVGGDGSATTVGNGGAGVASSITGSSVTYAGGGGGGNNSVTASSGGAGGGGGGGANPTLAVAGTPNTGGGGGGGGSSNTTVNGYPASGGSGVVIIRYLA